MSGYYPDGVISGTTTMIEMNEHTPQPWQVEGPFTHRESNGTEMQLYLVTGTIAGRGGRTIAELGCWRDRSNTLADARLIAAAPALMEALRTVGNEHMDGLLCWCDFRLHESIPFGEHDPECIQARTAIAAAGRETA